MNPDYQNPATYRPDKWKKGKIGRLLLPQPADPGKYDPSEPNPDNAENPGKNRRRRKREFHRGEKKAHDQSG